MKTLPACLLAGLGSFLPVAGAVESCGFDCTLMRHLDAIQARDYARFESTLTKGDRLVFILWKGEYSEDPAEYRKALKEWFVKGGWTFDYKIVALEKTAEMGSALLRVSYHEKERDGQPYDLDHYLLLIFKKAGDGWYLVHDQNTAIEAKGP